MSNAYIRDHAQPHDGFDVRADFDGRGPKYSELYGPQEPYDESEFRVDSHKASYSRDKRESTDEYVSVPILGEE